MPPATYLDEVGRTRDSTSDAIVMPGTRRIPPVADVTYLERVEKHNTALVAENHELRQCNKALRSERAATASRVIELETEKRMMLEELDRLRACVAVTAEQCRDHEVTRMFLAADNEKLADQVAIISGQNAALATGLIGTPMGDKDAGKLFVSGTVSDPDAVAYQQRLNELDASSRIPALPTIPLERAKYSAEDRVKCLLAKVGVLPGDPLTATHCANLTLAMEPTDPANQAAVDARCQQLCGDAGLDYPSALAHFVKNSAGAALARAEKTLQLTTVYP